MFSNPRGCTSLHYTAPFTGSWHYKPHAKPPGFVSLSKSSTVPWMTLRSLWRGCTRHWMPLLSSTSATRVRRIRRKDQQVCLPFFCCGGTDAVTICSYCSRCLVFDCHPVMHVWWQWPVLSNTILNAHGWCHIITSDRLPVKAKPMYFCHFCQHVKMIASVVSLCFCLTVSNIG